MDFRFKVVGLADKVDSECNLTVGKTYAAKNGIVCGNDDYEFTTWADNGATFENLQEWWKEWYQLEFVEEILPEPEEPVNVEEPVKIDDPVNHPSHYTKGKIEVADFIADQKLNFDRGNAVKYVCRAGSKDPEKEIQDLEKAIWYINHEIKMLKGEDADAAQKES